ncbi:hypothetical protein BG000_003026 [Podila horticola]|nr:hypothetical protein BG000_003026 [Podila horticola]
MQSSYMYQLPISNIAYHVCSHEEDLDTTQEISRRAFQRTMDSYHEHEQLADVFQVELDKQQQLTRERKEREKMLKQNKHKSKRQNRSQSQQPHPHPPHSSYSHRHLYSALFPSSSTFLPSHEHLPPNDQKRPRRLSDISNNGYGSNATRMPKAHDDDHDLTRSSPNDPSRSFDRSQSSTPAYPLTPSPRLTPSSHPSNDLDASGSAQPNSTSSTPSEDTPSISTHTPTLPNLSSTGGARKKRKQAIPVRSSVIDRIPGITLRIQPDRQGEQLQVEILKNLEDYPRRSSEENAGEPNDTPQTQAKQDMAKIKESIESGRPGYAMFPPGHFGSSHPYPENLAHAYRDLDLQARRSSEFTEGRVTKEKSSASLEWMSSMESLMAHHEMLESRAQPLSWETFSTRECVVNKVIGKHDQDLELLEEVVQDAVARQHYNSSTSPSNERDSPPANSPTTNPQRKSSTSTHTRPSKPPTGPPPPAPSKSGAIRTTRSRVHGTEKDGKDDGPQLVAAHEDIELILKEKRRKKRQERERLSSRASSTATHIEGDDDDEHDSQTRESSMDKSADHDMDEQHSDDDEDDGDVRMVSYGKQTLKRRGWDENDNISEVSLGAPRSKTSKHPRSEDSSRASTEMDESSDDGNDAEDDPDYKNRNIKSAAIAPRSQAMRPPQKAHEDGAKANRMPVGASDLSATSRSGKSSISSTPPLTPTKPTHEPSNKTRARAKSFSSTIVATEQSNFFESALASIALKRKETLAKRRAEEQKRETDAKAEDLKREMEAKAQELKRETEANTQRQLKELQAQKIEASNLPKSSKSLPGRVLRRTRQADSTDSAVDPDCTSCRLELSPSDKIAWKSATDDGEIKLPKTWGSHAILCTACRLQYLDHHTRCTACFYVPVKEEMDTGGSSCSRCKFGTWLNESAHIGSSSSRHRKTTSDVTL